LVTFRFLSETNISFMGFYSRYIFPRMMNWGMSLKTITPFLQEILTHARGKVLELGFGTGLNLPYLLPGSHSGTACRPSQSSIQVERAQAQVYRVLKPNGQFLFAEQGLSDEPGVQQWQHRLTPL
jgi:hypothetical protein